MYKYFVVSLAVIMFVSFNSSHVVAAAEANKCIALFQTDAAKSGSDRRGKSGPPPVSDKYADSLIARLQSEAASDSSNIEIQLAFKLFQIADTLNNLFADRLDQIPNQNRVSTLIRQIVKFYQANIIQLAAEYKTNLQELGHLNEQLLKPGANVESIAREIQMFKDEQDQNLNSIVKRLLGSGLQHSIYGLGSRVGNDAIIEIRGPSLSVSQISGMYSNLAKKKGWRVEIINSDDTSMTLGINGEHALTLLSPESGQHLVVRNEKGRPFRNYADVVVYAPVKAETLVHDEIISRIVFVSTKAEGAGGQHVQKNETAIQATYEYDGIKISVKAQEFRSQAQNREHAIERILGRLEAINEEKKQQAIRGARQQTNQSTVREYRLDRDARLAKAQLDGNIIDGLHQNFSTQEKQVLELFLAQIQRGTLFDPK